MRAFSALHARTKVCRRHVKCAPSSCVSLQSALCNSLVLITSFAADELDIPALNQDLPEQIRVFASERVTKGFNAKDQCNARTYTYTLPSISFANYQQEHDYVGYRIEPSQLQTVKDTLKLYEGTKNFHNFTSRK